MALRRISTVRVAVALSTTFSDRLADTVERPTVARSVTDTGIVTVTGARSVWLTVASAGARAVTHVLAAPWFGVLGVDVLFEEAPPLSKAMAPPSAATT